MKRALLILFLTTSTAWGHNWYPSECCNGNDVGGDCHPVPCSEITDDGWAQDSRRWHDMIFYPDKIFHSPDGQCHVCANERVAHGAYCMFLPGASS